MEVSPDTACERKVIWIYTTVNEIPDIIFEHEEVPKVDSNQPQYMRRYSAHSLTEVFRAMGCQQPLSAAMSDWMFNFLQLCPASQLSAILGDGSNNLFDNQRTYSKSGQFVVLTRMQFHRLACATLHVHQFRKIRYSVDFRLTLDFMEDRRFFIILLSGAPGTGKSTMASLIASRMSVNHILSTDSIRHAMRTFYPKEKYPILYKSTYECGDVVDPDHQLSEAERCIKGYQEQSDLVGKQLTSVIKSFVDLRSSLIVEGVHLSISVMLNLVQQFPNVVPFLVYIKKEDFHKQRFAVRAKFMTTDPSQNRYISHFDSIRCVQSFLSEGASQHLLPKIDNRNIDRSLETMHQTIFSYLKKLKGRKSMYDESTQKLSFLYSVWKRRKQKITSKSKSLKAIKSLKKAPIEEIYQKGAQETIQTEVIGTTSSNNYPRKEELANINNESSKNTNYNDNSINEDIQQQVTNNKEMEYQILYDDLQAALPVEGKRISSDYMDGNIIQYLKNGSMLMLYDTESENEEMVVQLKRKASGSEFKIISNNESMGNGKSEVSSVSSSQSSSANLIIHHHNHQASPSILNSGCIVDGKPGSQNSLNNDSFSQKSLQNPAFDKYDTTSSKKALSVSASLNTTDRNLTTNDLQQNLSSSNKSNASENAVSNTQNMTSLGSQNIPLSSSINQGVDNNNDSANVIKFPPPNQNFSEVSATTSMVMSNEIQNSVNRKSSELISIENNSNQTFVSNGEEVKIVINSETDQKSARNDVSGDSKNLDNDSISNDNDNFTEFPDTETDMDPAEVTLTDFVETTDSEAVDWKSFLAACGNNHKNFNFNFNLFHQQQQDQQQLDQQMQIQQDQIMLNQQIQQQNQQIQQQNQQIQQQLDQQIQQQLDQQMQIQQDQISLNQQIQQQNQQVKQQNQQQNKQIQQQLDQQMQIQQDQISLSQQMQNQQIQQQNQQNQQQPDNQMQNQQIQRQIQQGQQQNQQNQQQSGNQMQNQQEQQQIQHQQQQTTTPDTNGYKF